MIAIVIGIYLLMILMLMLISYEIGKRVGHRKGVACEKTQQAHIQSCREKGLAPGARLKYGMPSVQGHLRPRRSGPPNTHPFSETRR